MIALVIDRSTDVQSVALVKDGEIIASEIFESRDSRSSDWPLLVRGFLASNGLAFDDVGEYVVGQGPGSFAGIRVALGFAQGLALPEGKEVKGLPDPAAFAEAGKRIAVIGDARRGRYWVVSFNGYAQDGDFKVVDDAGLVSSVTPDAEVMTPDGARIGELLKEKFGQRYCGSKAPLAKDLAKAFIANPQLLVREPLPIYLQPAVRPN